MEQNKLVRTAVGCCGVGAVVSEGENGVSAAEAAFHTV